MIMYCKSEMVVTYFKVLSWKDWGETLEDLWQDNWCPSGDSK